MKNTDYYDRIIERIILKSTDFWGGNDYSLFKHEKSMHTHTTAYGLPHVRQVCFCNSKVSSEFRINEVFNSEDKKSRYCLKLTAAWKEWRKYEHPGSIKINGNVLFDRHLFLENVCSGWPSLYFDIPNEFLITENNLLEIENRSDGENTLLVDRVEIHQMTDVEDFSLFFCPDFVNAEDVFQVGLHLLKPHESINVNVGPNLEFLRRSGNIFHFKALRETSNESIEFQSVIADLNCMIDEIYPAKKEKIYVGFDGDDVRHDESGEMDRCLEYLRRTQMGNFVVFRTSTHRNCCDNIAASSERWGKWFKFCNENGISYQVNHNEITANLDRDIYDSKNFKGWQLHEPYLIFQPMNRHKLPQNMQETENLDNLKEGYIKYLSDKADNARNAELDKVHYGDPSMLSAYMRDAKADSVLCEPVGNSSLSYGTARGTGKEFGAHIAADWYIGYPHDENALKRFKILTYLNYAYGGKSIYVESSAFKTNAFSRNDRDDKFCLELREIIRSFYRFTCSDQRQGKPDVPLALIYGNNESMFWLPDDRIAEMPDHENWDNLFWGKWGDGKDRWLWKASEAWLPVLEYDDSGKDQSLTRMFTGSPYGSVDVVLPDSDLSKYKAVAFTGWNTMTERIYQNLISYVKGGGVLFICGAHFDMRSNPEEGIKLLRDGNLNELIGVNISGIGETVYGKFRTGSLTDIQAEKKSDFLYQHCLGEGRVYYYNFLDYPSDFRLVKDIKSILKGIGSEINEGATFSVSGKDASFINFNLWDKSKLYMTNVNWRKSVNAILKNKDEMTEKEYSFLPGETKIIESCPV